VSLAAGEKGELFREGNACEGGGESPSQLDVIRGKKKMPLKEEKAGINFLKPRKHSKKRRR